MHEKVKRGQQESHCSLVVKVCALVTFGTIQLISTPSVHFLPFTLCYFGGHILLN